MRAVDSRRHKTSHSGRLLDDGRRLLYMSCTGMKRLLFITYSQRRTDSQLHTGRDAVSPREHSWGAERVTGSVSAQVAGDQADGGEVVLDHPVAAREPVKVSFSIMASLTRRVAPAKSPVAHRS